LTTKFYGVTACPVFDEVADISFIKGLFRILARAAYRFKEVGTFFEKTASAFFDAIMDTDLPCVSLSKKKWLLPTPNVES
jgi:hypothetical protein